MSRLKVVLRGTVVSEIELSPEKEYVGGRKEGCDIRLQPEKGISREHFKIKYNDGKWQIIAISRFGDVFSLGQKIEQADLVHSQSFHVPPYDFTFLDLPEAVAAGGERPRIPLEINENTRTILGATPQMPYIKVVNAKGDVREMLRLEVGEVWVAGRDPACQINIADQRVSRRQFEIHKVNGAYTIIDLASVNGTFLNGTPVSSTDPQTLKSGDSLSVLDNVMYFELHDPNFKYKIENIEIPQVQIDPVSFNEKLDAQSSPYSDSIIEDIDDQAPELSQVEDMDDFEESDLPLQIQNEDGGPFTGMTDQQNNDANQFYTFNQQVPPQAGASTQTAPASATSVKKSFYKNPPLMIALILALAGGAYWYVENSTDTLDSSPKVLLNESDPFNKLTPEQQKEVKANYELAQQMYTQQKYDLALEKIRKIETLLPEGYLESTSIRNEAEQANLTIVQKQKDEEAQKEAEERTAKIKKVLEDCRKLLTPDVIVADMSQCLAPVTAIDPNDAEYIKLMSEAEKIEQDRAAKLVEDKSKEENLAQFQSLFDRAANTQSEGYAFKAMRQYQLVLDSKLPDPKNLKKTAEQRIEFIKLKIKNKSEVSISAADTFFKQGKLRDAIITLRDAVVYDPDNFDIKEKIDSYTYELTRQVRSLYQDSIIDENYGLIENTETKEGAKQKWKKITDLDLEDGEYYRKAIVKLKRYGVL